MSGIHSSGGGSCTRYNLTLESFVSLKIDGRSLYIVTLDVYVEFVSSFTLIMEVLV